MFQTGFNVEGILLDDDGNVEGHIAYEPLENPLDPGSAHVTVNLTKFTGNTENYPFAKLFNNIFVRNREILECETVLDFY